MNYNAEEYLKKLYYDPTSGQAFAGADALHRKVKSDGLFNLTRGDVEKWLSQQDLHTLNYDKKSPQLWNSIVNGHVGAIDMDIGYLKSGAKRTAFLSVINPYTLKGYARSLKDVTGRSVSNALAAILDEIDGEITHARSDRGSEFLSYHTCNLLKARNINHFFAYAPKKASVSEGHIRLIKNRLSRYLENTGRKAWDRVLADVIHGLNNRKVRSLLHHSPNEVSASVDLQNQLWFQRKRDNIRSKPPPTNYKYSIGQVVRYRLSNKGLLTSKDYKNKNSELTYTIAARKNPQNLNRYMLRSSEGDILPSSYPESQLTKVATNQTRHIISQIHARRSRNGQRQIQVSWQGQPDQIRSWINAREEPNHR